jgi:hypothetical protein
MNRPLPANLNWKARILGAAAMLAAVLTSASGRAQVTTADVKGADSGEVTQASCTTCAAEKLFPYQSPTMPLGCTGCMGNLGCGGCGGDCGGPGCVPGRLDCCAPCDKSGALGRLFCGLHAALCCPDPCYEPCFIPAANAGFFLDSAKPVSQARFRYDAIIGGTTPTQGGYFWASGAAGPGNVPFTAHDLVMENEIAVDRFSLIVSTPFRITVGTGGAGYSDMRIATKSLLVDSELLLVSFQFSTILPTGIAATGGGNGNVGLEPSLLTTLKIAEGTYFQTQLSEWIGVITQESVFHYHFSVNHMFAAPRPDMQFIATLEYGSYVFPTAPAFYNIGPGFRFQFCRKVDIGFGMQFAVSNNHFFDQFYRTELRWRF